MRVFNFSPGPAVLPLEVLEQARDELLDWQGSGMSVMEVSHRGKAFVEVAAQAETDLRELMSIPRNFKVLFMQGGASAQFSLVPMNLTTPQATVDYVNTGHWSPWPKRLDTVQFMKRLMQAGPTSGCPRSGNCS